jgi:hypothetical protein
VTVEFDGTDLVMVTPVANSGFLGGTLTATTAMSGAALNETFATIASAATVNIGAAAANYLQVTGTTAITGFDAVQAGTRRVLEFAGGLTLTHNPTSLILPTGNNIATAAGDAAIFVSEGGGNWRCVGYMKVSGKPLVYLAPSVVIVQDRKSSGTNGSPLTTNTFTDRDLTTVALDSGSIASISTPNLSLPAGTYDVEAELVCAAPSTSSQFKSRIFNATGTAVLQDVNSNDIVSTNGAVAGGIYGQTIQTIKARFVLGGSTNIKFQTWADAGGNSSRAGSATNGTGNSESEIYLNARFVKVA